MRKNHARKQFAEAAGLSAGFISQLLGASQSASAEAAGRLAVMTGSEAAIWLREPNLIRHCHNVLARRKAVAAWAERQK